jgi:hypothetical protein
LDPRSPTPYFCELSNNFWLQFFSVPVQNSVADPDPNPDPDPPEPHVFGPPGSGSGSFYHHAKNSKKNLDSYFFVTLFDFLSLKNDVNLASKSNKQKKLY